jgi:hypothetical protein
MKPLQLRGPRVAEGNAAEATATAVASLGTGHVSVASPRRTTLPERPTPRNLAAPPPLSPRTSPLVQPTWWLNTASRAMGSGLS